MDIAARLKQNIPDKFFWMVQYFGNTPEYVHLYTKLQQYTHDDGHVSVAGFHIRTAPEKENLSS